EKKDYEQFFSNIIAHENFIYFVAVKRSEIVIVRINKQTLEKQEFFIENIKDTSDRTAKTPFMRRKSLGLHKDKLYYVNGLGHVYSFDMNNQKVNRAFEFLDYEKESPNIIYEEQIDFKDNLIYFFRLNNNIDEYTLEKYDLDNGERVYSESFPVIKEFMEKHLKKSIATYDLLI